jgi:hypothetical protein
MVQQIKWTIIFLPIIVTACGVKSRPLPPLTPPPIGKGAPDSENDKERTNKTKKKASPELK